jgi:hypothetical protein
MRCVSAKSGKTLLAKSRCQSADADNYSIGCHGKELCVEGTYCTGSIANAGTFAKMPRHATVKELTSIRL